MKVEKLIMWLVGVGMVTILTQAVIRKMLIFNVLGFVTSTLHLSIALILVPTATYGLCKIIDTQKSTLQSKGI